MGAYEIVPLARDCEATRIPYGEKLTLRRGMQVEITQSLGGTFTVITEEGQMVSIAGKDADAIGREKEVRAEADKVKHRPRGQIYTLTGRGYEVFDVPPALYINEDPFTASPQSEEASPQGICASETDPELANEDYHPGDIIRTFDGCENFLQLPDREFFFAAEKREKTLFLFFRYLASELEFYKVIFTKGLQKTIH